MSAVDRVKQYVRDHEDDWYLAWEDVSRDLGGKMLFYDLVDETDWTSIYEGVIEFEDGFVHVARGHGSTESQEHDALSDCLDDVYLVEPYEVTVTKYRRVR